MPDFVSDVLNKKVSETEKPVPKPVGTYLVAVLAVPEKRDVQQRDGAQREVITFQVKAMAAQADVDQEKLADPKVGDLSAWPPRNYDIYGVDTPEGENRLKEFLVNILGLDPGDKTYAEIFSETPGKQFLATFEHRPFTDKNTGQPEISWDIKSVAKV